MLTKIFPLLPLYICCFLFQNLSAQTYVLDAQQHAPIADVRVAYGNNEIVVYTDNNGKVDSTTTGCFTLFHPAYYTKRVCDTDTVYLLKKTELIAEVNISDNTICQWAVPKGKRKGNHTIWSGTGDMHGVEVGGKDLQGHRIGEVRFKLKKNHSDNLRVRVHLANPSDTGKSFIEPISSADETFLVGDKKGWIDLDLKEEYLILPEYPVAVMLEFISSTDSSHWVLATFKEPAYDSYYLRRGLIFKNWRSWCREYTQLGYPVEYFVPAITVEVCR